MGSGVVVVVVVSSSSIHRRFPNDIERNLKVNQ